MRILVNAIITGFGIKLGGDLYKFFKQRVGIFSDIKDDDAPLPADGSDGSNTDSNTEPNA